MVYLLFRTVAGVQARQQQNPRTRNMEHQKHVDQTAKEEVGPVMFMRSIKVNFLCR